MEDGLLPAVRRMILNFKQALTETPEDINFHHGLDGRTDRTQKIEIMIHPNETNPQLPLLGATTRLAARTDLFSSTSLI